MNKLLPEFDKPPVIEVVCGLQFNPISALSVPYIGRLWSKFEADYPKTREAAPLLPTIEQFGEGSRGSLYPFGDELPPPRIWFESADGNRLIQVQRDRFMHNWKKERDTACIHITIM